METLDYTQPMETNNATVRAVEVLTVEENNDRVMARITYMNGTNDTFFFKYSTGVKAGDDNSDTPLRLRNCSAEKTQVLFYLTFGKEDWSKDQWKAVDWDRYAYDNGKKASEQAKKFNELSRESGSAFRFRVARDTRNASATDWKGWMERRFSTGEYVRPVWKDEEWFKGDDFAHPSLKDGARIAFISSDENGLADKFTIMQPGRYLKQYYGDVLDDDQIAHWATKFDVDSELKFATTPEEIAATYMNSRVASCMSYRPDHFGHTQHPTEVYAAGDLAVAYLRRRGQLAARSVVWPEKKVWLRLYGDVRRLEDQLRGQGYRPGRALDFQGARLLRRESPRGRDRVVIPYLDLGLQANLDPEDDSVLRISRCGSISGCNHSSADSAVNEIHQRTCGYCGINRLENGQGHYYPEFSRMVCDTCTGSSRLRGWQCTFSGDWFQRGGVANAIKVLNPVTGEEAGVVASTYVEYHEEIVKVGRSYYLREGLSWDSSKKQWALPPTDEQREAA